jgi:type II secretory pathway component PulF
MPVYQYNALDDLGHKLHGQMEVPNEAALELALQRRGHWLTEARERKTTRAATARGRGNRAVSRRVLIEFFLQTSLQLRSGIALVDALAFGLRGTTHAGFAEVQANVLERVRSGASFSEALAAHPRTFAPLVVNLIRAGEASGQLQEVCAEIRRYYEWLDRLMSDIRQALLYPSFVLAATMAFFVLVFTYLIPRFAQVLSEIKVRMPFLTKVFLALSQFMVAHGWWLAIIGVGIVTAWMIVPRFSRPLARAQDRLRLAVPIFGEIHHLICLSRVAQNLATLYRAGVPLLSSLQLCRSLVGNRVLEDAMVKVEAAVNGGRPMHEAMQEDAVFSRLMVQMVAIGETTGSLGDSLNHVADYYNDIVPRQVKKLLTILEPVLIVGLIVMVGSVALAVFLPIAAMFDAK